MATTFGAYTASQPASAPAAGALSATERAEVAQRSRAWAVAAIMGTAVQSEANVIAAPPLYFARLQVVSNAAAGETLAQLQAELNLPTSPGVWAGLMKGVARSVSAAPEAVVTGSFMRAASLVGYPDLARQPNLRLSVSDSLFALGWAWPAASKITATYTYSNGSRSLLSLIQVRGTVSMVDGNGYQAKTLALPGQTRLVRITPSDPISTWDSAMLNRALEETAALSAPTERGELTLLAGAQGKGVDWDDTRGLSLAVDPVKANLQGLDGMGGTYIQLSGITASAWIDDTEVRPGGSQNTQFIFSPLNENITGGVVVDVTFPPPPCSGPAADIAPYFLALVRDNGSVTFLARMASLGGTACADPIFIGSP
jgi:hypothetical protein